MKKIRVISFIICIILCGAMLAACADSSGRNSNNQTGVSDVLQAGIDEAQSESGQEEPETDNADISETSEDKTDANDESATEDSKQFSDITETTEPQTLERPEVLSNTPGIDVDLTILSSTMVYSEVYNMMLYPDEYKGKTIKMNGAFATYHDDSTGNDYFACIIKDATACCAQGIEFELTDNYKYPDDYPEVDEEVTVVGEFDTYQEGEFTYNTLRNATLEG